MREARFADVDAKFLMLVSETSEAMSMPQSKSDMFVDGESEPPMSLDKFMDLTGLSSVTLWRFRKKGFLRTINICGRHYVLRSEIARFNARAAAGEFALHREPPRRKRLIQSGE